MLQKIIENLLHERKINKTDLCKHLGIARSTLDGYLNRRTSMPADKIQQTAKFFGVSVGYLFGETEKEQIDLRKQLEEQQKQINKLNKKIETIAKTLQMEL